jgi:light-regulated signal transduction histidine kinase (bacteriophytochrome)
MKAASATQLDASALEDLGRATLRIVHDLKNQLNGLKLYATFLRKRLERDEHSQEERETVEKLVAGLDRAAKDLTALVRYGQPLDLRQQSGVDLRSIIQAAAHDPAQRVTGALSGSLLGDNDAGPLVGSFDPHALAEAFSSLAREAGAVRSASESIVTLHAERSAGEGPAKAVVEWRGLTLRDGAQPGIHAQFAKRVIEAHGGVVEFDHDKIRVTLPLAE